MGIVDNPRPGCKTTGEMEPWWLNFVLEGFEDDDSDDDEDEDESEDDEDEDESEDDEDDDDSDEDDEDEDDEDDEEDTHNLKDPKKKNIAGLKSALRKERMGHKKFKRLYEAERKKNKTKSSSNEEDKGSKDDKESKEDKGPSERELKLAARLRDSAIDTQILKFATKLKFIDPEDAVRLVKRSDIEFDQDEEDPTLIEIDEESVEDAVKQLARKKRHLVNRGKTTGKTGSKFGGSNKGKNSINDDEIRKKFGLARTSL